MTKSSDKEELDWVDVVNDLHDKTAREETRDNKKREKEHDNEVKAHRKRKRASRKPKSETDEQRRERRYRVVETD